MTADVEPRGRDLAVDNDVENMEKQQDVKTSPHYQDAFGDEEFAEVKYKVLNWW